MSEVIHMSDVDMQVAEVWYYSRGDLPLIAIARAAGCNLTTASKAVGKHLHLLRDHVQRKRSEAAKNGYPETTDADAS